MNLTDLPQRPDGEVSEAHVCCSVCETYFTRKVVSAGEMQSCVIYIDVLVILSVHPGFSNLISDVRGISLHRFLHHTHLTETRWRQKLRNEQKSAAMMILLIGRLFPELIHLELYVFV